MTFASTATIKREAQEEKERQREAEKLRQQNIREQLEANSVRGIRRAEREDRESQEAEQQARIRELRAEQASLTGQLRTESFQLLLQQADPEFPRDIKTLFHTDIESSAAEKAERFCEDEFNAFVQATPSFYSCPENSTILTAFFKVNQNAVVINRDQFAYAYNRLRDVGLLVEGPVRERTAPTPEPWSNIEDYDWSTGKPTDIIAGWDWNNPTERCSLTHKQLNELLNNDERAYKIFCRDAMKSKPAEKQPDGEYGYERGEKVWKSAWEVAQMGSDEYRRFAKPRTNIDQLLTQPELISDL